MDPNGFYLRLRGQISGLYTLEELKKLIARGGVSRIHEISRDRIAWAAAGTLKELFPDENAGDARTDVPFATASPIPARFPSSAPATSTAIKAEPIAGQPPLAVSDLASLAPAPVLVPTEPPGSRRFYYRQRGIVIGPLPWQSLKHLAKLGKVEPSAEVWSSVGEEPTSASTVPGLMIAQHEPPAEASPQLTRAHLWIMAGIAAVSLLIAAATLSYIFFAK